MKKVITLVSLFCITLTGCQSGSNPSPCKKKVLNTCFMRMPPTVDPRRIGDPISSTLSFMIFEGLTRYETEGYVENALAQSIDISEDGKTYTFHLRDTQWTDGHPVTAHDFEYTWKTLLAPNFPSVCPYLFYPIKNAEKAKRGDVNIDAIGVTALDDKTLQVELENPTDYFLKLISFCIFSPIPKHIDESNPNWFKNPNDNLICNGPFKIHSWRNEDEIQVTKNTTFWESDTVDLDKIAVSIIQDASTALQLFQQGSIDWMNDMVASIPLDALTTLSKEGKIDSVPVGNTVFVSFNVNEFPFTNANIRKAFSLSIDRKSITDHVTQLKEQPANRVIPPALATHQVAQAISSIQESKQALAHFAKGLEELGLTKDQFPEITFTFPSVEPYREVGQVLQQQWQNALGVKIKMNGCEMKTFFDQLQNRSYQFGEAVWWAQYADPMSIFERFRFGSGKKNYPGWDNKEFQTLLTKADSTNDSALRTSFLKTAEDVLIREIPLTPVYHFNSNSLRQPYVAHANINPCSTIQLRNVKLLDEKR